MRLEGSGSLLRYKSILNSLKITHQMSVRWLVDVNF